MITDLRVNDAPTANAGPDQQAWTGYGIALDAGGSSDPQGDALTYHWSFYSIPVSSSASLQGTNTIQPVFTADVPGTYVIRLVVNDGTLDSAPDMVTVTAQTFQPNHPPQIDTNPPPAGWGMVGVPYTYQVNATDPDGDPLTYHTVQCPAGMSINETNGFLTWTPTALGGYPINLVVRDDRGGFVVMAFVVTVYQYEELPPQITSTPPGTVEPGQTYAYDVEATDPNEDTLTYALTQSPAGMTISATTGLIQWTPSSGDMGGHPVTVVVSDPTGLAATQDFCVVVVQSSASSPVVMPIPDQVAEEPATFAQIRLDDYVSDPDHTDNQLVWTASGNTTLVVQISASRIATISYAPGTRVSEWITFLATDPGGYSGFSTARFTVKGTDQPPVAVIANLATNYSIDGITTVRDGIFDLEGIADDPDAADDVSYRVTLFDSGGKQVADMTPQPVNREGYHEGRVTATGLLGKLDFTLIENGTYDLYLDVKGGDKTATAWAPIALDSQLKVGHFTFSQQDIVIPVHGIPLTVIRTYDSLNQDAGDFGYSWTYSISDVDMEFDETRAIVEDVFGDRFSMRQGGGWDVTLTLPDGRRTTFVFELQRAANTDCPECPSFMYKAVWRAPPGVYATLQPTCSDTLVALFGMTYWEAAGPETPMEWFDFPGFILTMKDGTRYRVDREDLGEHFISSGVAGDCFVHSYGEAMLTQISNLNSDRVEFVRSGEELDRVDHYNAVGEKTKSLVFNRDAQGRIDAIYDPACLDTNGNPVGPASMTYEYDAVGNLWKVNKLTDKSNPADPVYLTTTFVYDNPAFPHYITAIQDPRGVTPMRNEYDEDGRLIATVDAFGHRIVYEHDLAARTETIYDRLGNATVYAYDDHGNIIATTDPLGHTTLRTYDDAGNETSVTDPLGHTTRRTYDDAGNLLTVTDPMTNTTHYTYNDQGDTLTIKDPLGNVSSNEYDATGNLVTKIDALGVPLEYEYDDGARLVLVKGPSGEVTDRFTYDRAGNLCTGQDAAGWNRTFLYDALGNKSGLEYPWVNPLNSNDVRLVTVHAFYDQAGQIVKTVGPDGKENTTTYDEIGKPAVVVDRLGNATHHSYDSLGNEVETVYPDGVLVRTVYDEEGRPVITTDRHVPGSLVNGTRSAYDALGRVVLSERLQNVTVGMSTQGPEVDSVLISAGTVISSNVTVYDANGRVAETIGTDGHRTQFEYDVLGQQTAMIDALGNRFEFACDGHGRRVSARDALDHEMRFEYDPLGHLVQTTGPDGGVTSNAYDDVGNLVAETDQTGKTRGFEYDTMKRLLAVVLPAVPDPENSGTPTRPRFEYGYDVYGNLLTIRDPKGRVTRFTYDYLNRLTSRTLPLGQTEHRSYNALGQIDRLTDFKGQVAEFLYDDLGRVSEKRLYETGADTPAQVISFTYDELGRQKRIVEARGTTEYGYDAEGRITSIASPEGTIHYDYDPTTGRKTAAWTANSDTRYGYDELARLKTVTVVKRNGELLSEPEVTTYNYSAVGSRQSMELPNGITTSYEYDDLNRLTNLFHTSKSGQLLASYAYTLAPDGRRIGVVERTATPEPGTTNVVTYTYDELNRLTREVTSLYTSEYEYDLCGNRLERRVTVNGQALTTRYGYNDNNQLLVESNALTSASSSASGGVTVDGYGASLQLHRPSAWSFYSYLGLVGCILISFFAPVAFEPLRSRRARSLPWSCSWASLRLFVANKSFRHPPPVPTLSRLLCALGALCVGVLVLPSVLIRVFCGSSYSSSSSVFRYRASLTLFARCTASMLAAIMFVGPLVTETLADDAVQYTALTTETWGKDGTVTTYTYDANGSCTSKLTVARDGGVLDETQYIYNPENRLSGASIHRQEGADDVVIDTAYTYDQSGIRVRSDVSRTVNGVLGTENTLFLIDPQNPTGYSQILEELPAFGAKPKMSCTIGDDVISQSAQVSGFNPQCFLYDGHGSTRLLATHASSVERYDYDAYGTILSGSFTITQLPTTDLMYSGEYFDHNLAVQYLRARYYDQHNGRFTQMDEHPGTLSAPLSLHRYGYASGDPVNSIDPSGQQDTLAGQMTALLLYVVLSSVLLVVYQSGLRYCRTRAFSLQQGQEVTLGVPSWFNLARLGARSEDMARAGDAADTATQKSNPDIDSYLHYSRTSVASRLAKGLQPRSYGTRDVYLSGWAAKVRLALPHEDPPNAVYVVVPREGYTPLGPAEVMGIYDVKGRWMEGKGTEYWFMFGSGGPGTVEVVPFPIPEGDMPENTWCLPMPTPM